MTLERPFYRFAKRAFDIAGSICLLPLLGPVMAVTWVVVRRRMGKPALFRQERAGLKGRAFRVVKFRSMIDAYDASGKPLPDVERVTPLGIFLRRSSLDELPQLWNVLKGDMSFVGPRPLYLEYVPRYSPEQRRRLDVKPGITGLAQISGRNTLGWKDRLRLDIEYVDRASLSLDFWILGKTVFKVLGSEGVPSSGVDPNKKFAGETHEDEA
ncbi:MAG: sugar transferase [Acidobacteria bacterium]|nr:sugar transferase [Acidobacteriota bacterium]